jgi:hypothetical protein
MCAGAGMMLWSVNHGLHLFLDAAGDVGDFGSSKPPCGCPFGRWLMMIPFICSE